MLKDNNIYICKSLSELEDFTTDFIKGLKYNDLIFLKGNLGAGKTTFVQFLISQLSDGQVNAFSPTFNIMHTYSTNIGDIIHSDLYRLKSSDEVEEIGLYDEIGNKVVIIEWPEIIEDKVKFEHWVLEFEILQDASRAIKFFKSS